MRNFFSVCVVLLLTCGLLSASTINIGAGTPLGGDWVNGYVLPDPGVGAFTTPSDPSGAPFNRFLGVDDDAAFGGSNFSASWAMNFDAALLGVAPTINGATLTLGLFDHDSAAAGDQVASFVFGGVDLTAELNALLEASGGGEFEYNIYTLTLPSTVYASILAGNIPVSLALQGPGQVIFFGETDPSPVERNGAGLDYSILAIDYANDVGEPVPEPGTIVLLSAGLALVGLSLRRKVRR